MPLSPPGGEESLAPLLGAGAPGRAGLGALAGCRGGLSGGGLGDGLLTCRGGGGRSRHGGGDGGGGGVSTIRCGNVGGDRGGGRGAGAGSGGSRDGRGGSSGGGRGAGSGGGGRSRGRATRGRSAQADAGEGHLGGGRRGSTIADRGGEVPGHGDVGPADAAVGHSDEVAGDGNVLAGEWLADGLAGAVVGDELELGASELAAAAHGDELAEGVGDLLPGDEGVGAVEGGHVGIALVGGAGGQPVDLAVAGCGADLAGGLLAVHGVLVAEGGDGDVAAVGAVGDVGVAVSHPVVDGHVLGTARDPGEDVGLAVLETSQVAVGAGHAAEGLTTTAVGDVLVGDLGSDGAHALALGVEPDSTLILGTDAGVGSLIGGLESNTSVVATAPGGGGTLDDHTLASAVLDVVNGVTEVALSRAAVGSDDGVSGVATSLGRVNKVTVHVRSSHHALVAVNIGTTQPGLPLLRAGSIETVQHGDRGVVRRGVGCARGHGLVGQQSKAVILSDETAGLLSTINGDNGARGLEGGRVDGLDVDSSVGRVEVGQVGRLSVGGDGEGSAAVVDIASPVGLLDGVEAARQRDGVDVCLQGRLGQALGRCGSGEGEQGWDKRQQ